MSKIIHYRMAVVVVLCFSAVACQTLTEEAPVNSMAEEEKDLAISSDENARKGNMLEFGAFLSGREQNPPIVAQGVGSASFTVMDGGNSVKFEVRVANTSGIVSCYIYLGDVGANGDVVVPLFTHKRPIFEVTNGIIAQGFITKEKLTGPLLGAELSHFIDAMKNGQLYVNIHTATNPRDIRGQVSAVDPSFNKNSLVKLSGSNEVPAVMTNATGVAKFQVNKDGSGIDCQVNVAGISDVRFAHIHLAKPGVNGPVVFTLRNDKVVGPVSGVYAKGTITASMLSGNLLGGDLIILREAMRTGNAYVNVHSDNFPGGELRGNF